MRSEQAETPPPTQLIYWRRALLWHSLGFLIILILTWCDSLYDLMHLIFRYPPQRADEMSETCIKLGVIVLLWLLSAMKLYQIVSRLSYLERFLHVCSWCRRIEYNNQWLSLEEHFLNQTGTAATHGICPDCAEKLKKEHEPVQKAAA